MYATASNSKGFKSFDSKPSEDYSREKSKDSITKYSFWKHTFKPYTTAGNMVKNLSPYKFLSDYCRKKENTQKIYLGAAATYQGSLVPITIKKREPNKLASLSKTKAANNDLALLKIKEQVKGVYDSFIVGVRRIKSISNDDLKKPPSPNPASEWAYHNNFDWRFQGKK